MNRQEILDRLGIDISPRSLMKELSVAETQMNYVSAAWWWRKLLLDATINYDRAFGITGNSSDTDHGFYIIKASFKVVIINFVSPATPIS